MNISWYVGAISNLFNVQDRESNYDCEVLDTEGVLTKGTLTVKLVHRIEKRNHEDEQYDIKDIKEQKVLSFASKTYIPVHTTLLCCAQYFFVLMSDAHISTMSKSELDAETFTFFILVQKGNSLVILNSKQGLLNHRRIIDPNRAYITAPHVPNAPSHIPTSDHFSYVVILPSVINFVVSHFDLTVLQLRMSLAS